MINNKFKTALITGSTKGVGKEIAKMFIKKNYNVIITGRNINNTLKIADELNSKNTKIVVKGFNLDYNNFGASYKLLHALKNKDIQPNFLINNAGALNTKNINNISIDSINTLTKINMIGPMVLSKYCIDIIKNKNEFGGILFNTPPYIIDDKCSYLLPYMQTKLAQTTLMKSLAYSNLNYKALVCGFWTNYPLSTDAIINRKIGKKENCMHPKILAKTLEELLFNTPDYMKYSSKIIIDKEFLYEKNINIKEFQHSSKVSNLDDMFYKYLKDKYTIRKKLFNI